jgi:copper transport protein
VLVKLASIFVLLIVARISRLTLRRTNPPPTATLATTRLRRIVGVELIVAAAVIGVTGWLAGASPIRSAQTSGPVTVTAPDTTGTATATVTITPATVGANSIHVTIDDPQGRTPDAVQMELAPADQRIAPIEATAYIAPGMLMSNFVEIPDSGDWTLTVSARFGEFDSLIFDLPFAIN